MHSIIRNDEIENWNRVRDDSLVKLWNNLFTWPRIFKRIKQLSIKGLPSAHIASWMVQSALRTAFREYIESWEETLTKLYNRV
jgi:hypothetical protein